jgi:hypothetical protein
MTIIFRVEPVNQKNQGDELNQTFHRPACKLKRCAVAELFYFIAAFPGGGLTVESEFKSADRHNRFHQQRFP